MHHSYRSLPEFSGMDATQRSLILKISGMRLWKAKNQAKRHYFNNIFLGMLPILCFYFLSPFVESEALQFGLLIAFIVIGYKINFHFTTVSLLPYIRECIQNGISEEEMSMLATVKKKSFAGFSLKSGVLAGVFFAGAMQIASGFAFGWGNVMFMGLFFGSMMGTALYIILKYWVQK